MAVTSTRRAALIGAMSLISWGQVLAAGLPGEKDLQSARERIAALEKTHGGRLGVMVLDMGTNAQLEYRAEERFPLTSTFKFLAAAGVLKLVDAGKEQLDHKIAYGADEVEAGYSPVTKDHAGEGMPLVDICAAAVVLSDNTAGNLLLQVLGGPEGLTRYARSLGDGVTRLDRTEPALNSAVPGDERDTTSPKAMLGDMKRILLGDELSPASRKLIETWLIDSKTGTNRIRAGLLAGWRVGDKTGSGGNGTTNDIAILWPPAGAPILAAVYYTGSTEPAPARNAVHADLARIIAETFAR